MNAVARCLAGEISPQVALAQLVLDGLTPDAIAAVLPAGSDLARLFEDQRTNLAAMAAMLRDSGVAHGDGAASPAETLARIGAMFDRAVALAPEASVAAYSLGDPALLARATDEIVRWLVAGALIHPAGDVLDLGCGIGRIAAALAPLVRSVRGLDISPGMIVEARRRHAAANLRFDLTDGTAGTGLDAASCDLVLAVDSFPYLVEAGIADDHVAEAARLLRPGGALVILNLSYRNDPVADARDADRWALRHGLAAAHERPFQLWDGAAFILRRPDGG